MRAMPRRAATAVALGMLGAIAIGACGGPAPSAATTSPGPTTVMSPSTSPTPGTSPSPTVTPVGSAGTGEVPRIALEPYVGGFESPLDIAWRPGDPDAIFVVEQGGLIRVTRDGQLVDAPVLDISERVEAGGEQGLLGLAFHPDPADGRLFVYYTALDEEQVVASFRMDPGDPDRADPRSETIVLKMADEFGNHNGGSLAFGPDGYLYIGTGDGGGGGDPLDSGRRLDTLLAKVLRIDIDVDPDAQAPAYAIPEGNPFVDRDGAMPEIWLTGLRNPWRMRFDRATGDLWIGDVGQGSWEEIDVARRGVGGLDFGWNAMEGTHCFATDPCADEALTLPVAEYSHDFGCTVVGGTVYRGASFPALAGWYVFADYCSGSVWAIDPTDDGPTTPEPVLETGQTISAIGEDTAGELYVTDLSSGDLLRVVAAD
jgi:glucose/arabinose dehydrogenase